MNPYGAPYGGGRACNVLSVADAAYIAGLIDGEGTIGLTYRWPSKRGACERMSLHVSVNISAAAVVRWLIESTGLGSLNGIGYAYSENRARLFRWNSTSNGAYTLVQQISPFLKLKCANAAALIRIHEEILESPLLRFDPFFIGQVKEHFHRLNVKGPGNWAVKERASQSENFAGARALGN